MNDTTNTRSNARKKDTFYIIILILTFIIVLIGATFAIFTFVKSQEEGSSAVYTGTFSIEYLDGKIINVGKLIPRDEPMIDDEDNLYKNEFKVSNTGSLDGLMDIYIRINKNEFSDDTLMYNLYDESGEIVSSGSINGEDDLLLGSDVTLDKESVLGYTLVIWINESYSNQNSEMRKSLIGTIEVEAAQKKG